MRIQDEVPNIQPCQKTGYERNDQIKIRKQRKEKI